MPIEVAVLGPWAECASPGPRPHRVLCWSMDNENHADSDYPSSIIPSEQLQGALHATEHTSLLLVSSDATMAIGFAQLPRRPRTKEEEGWNISISSHIVGFTAVSVSIMQGFLNAPLYSRKRCKKRTTRISDQGCRTSTSSGDSCRDSPAWRTVNAAVPRNAGLRSVLYGNARCRGTLKCVQNARSIPANE